MAERTTAKRVRTGCMTCRRRRRKCDEGRPECANCLSKSLTCQYGSQLTFVASKFQNAPKHATTRPRRSRDISPSGSATNLPSFQHVVDSPQPSEDLFVGSNHFSQPVTAATDLPSDPAPTRNRSVASIPNQPSHSHAPAAVYDTRNARRRLYELELLTYYRYNVAPVLDLGLGNPRFGVKLMLASKTSEAVYHTLLGLASSQRASMRFATELVDQATSVTSAHLARPDSENHYDIFAPCDDLWLWKDVCQTPIYQWHSIAPRFLHHAHHRARVFEDWLLCSRLHCAVSMITLQSASDPESFPPPPNMTEGDTCHPAVSQLGESLWLLEKVVALLFSKIHPVNSPGLPIAQAWLAHWQELQNWYVERRDEMRQLFLLADEVSPPFQQQDNVEFPHIVFTSACAIVANVAHHVASFALLQSKPRLIKPTARPNSSSSSLWHAHRAIGIVSTAADAEIWDPFMTAALLFCSRNLSNVAQIRLVAGTMKRIQASSGLKLEEAIGDLEELARKT